MQKIDSAKVTPHGSGSFSMRTMFTNKSCAFSLVTILPGDRVPITGYSCHDRDEYSYFVSGELVTNDGVVRAGEATLIERGEKHWCRNEGSEPVVIVCMLTDNL